MPTINQSTLIVAFFKFTLALFLAVLGGLLAKMINTPLPWLLGATTITAVAALTGLPVAMPRVPRLVMVMILGLMMGSRISPELFGSLGFLCTSIVIFLSYLTITTLLSTFVLNHILKFDAPTAYFSSLPGGLNEIAMIGQQNGGALTVIFGIQLTRILILVSVIPLAFEIVLGFSSTGQSTDFRSALSMSVFEYMVLLGCGSLGVFIAKQVKAPAAVLLGPMILAALITFLDLADTRPPYELISIAQLVIGCTIGCQFAQFSLKSYPWILFAGFISILVAGCVGVLAAVIVNIITGRSIPALLLSYSPGGFTEMGLLAVAMSVDVALVGAHHFLRVVFVVLFADFLFSKLQNFMKLDN